MRVCDLVQQKCISVVYHFFLKPPSLFRFSLFYYQKLYKNGNRFCLPLSGTRFPPQATGPALHPVSSGLWAQECPLGLRASQTAVFTPFSYLFFISQICRILAHGRQRLLSVSSALNLEFRSGRPQKGRQTGSQQCPQPGIPLRTSVKKSANRLPAAP